MRHFPAFPLFLVICGANAFAGSTAFTLLIVYQVQVVGLGPLQLVLTGTALEIVCFIAQVPTGVIADLYSRRLSVIIGFLLLGVGTVLWAALPSYTGGLLATVVWGIGAVCIDGALQAWAAAEIGESRIGSAFARSAQVGQLCAVAGMAAAAGLSLLGPAIPLWVGGAVYGLLGLVLLVTMPETAFRPVPNPGPDHPAATPDLHAVDDIGRHFSAMRHQVVSGSRIIRRSPLLLGLVGAALFDGMSSEGFDRLGQAQLLDVGGIPAPTAIWLAGLSIVAMLVSVLLTEGIRRRLDAMSGRGMVLLTAALYAAAFVGLLAFAVGGGFAPLAAAYVVVSASRSSCRPVVNAALVAATAPATRATVFSFQSQAGALGQVAGGPPVGAIAQGYGLSAGLTCAACFLAPVVGCLLGAARQVHRNLPVRSATMPGRPHPGRGTPSA